MHRLRSMICSFTGKELVLWTGSMAAVLFSNLFSGNIDAMKLSAALIGVTSLILEAKGNVISQFLMIVFSIMYAVISYQFRYYGEMITYLAMTLPMAVWCAIVWIRHPSKEDKNIVAVGKITKKSAAAAALSAVLVTAVLGWLLFKLDTPNLVISIVSVATSFIAAAFGILRSPLYGIGYAVNDMVLVIMWILASLKDPGYVPMIVNFAIFFVNDMYGFVSWRKREKNLVETL